MSACTARLGRADCTYRGCSGRLWTLDSGVRNFVKSPQTIYILNTSDQCIWFSEVLLLYNLGFETSKLYYKLHN